MGRGLTLYTGRVIALGRLLLATLFMAAIGIDISQPAQAPMETYALLVAYQVFAAAIAALTWNDWWLDAKLAGPAHAVDIILFTIIVYLTEGYTSPFFIFSNGSRCVADQGSSMTLYLPEEIAGQEPYKSGAPKM